MLLSTWASALGTLGYKKSIEKHHAAVGQSLAKTAARFVDGDSLNTYLETRSIDRAYADTQRLLQTLREENSLAGLYIIKPVETGSYYIYDTAPVIQRRGLGASLAREAGTSDSTQQLLSLKAPVYGSGGIVTGYAVAELRPSIPFETAQGFLHQFWTVFCIPAVVTTGLCLLMMRRYITLPINRMAKAANAFLIHQTEEIPAPSSSLTELTVKSNDEIASLASSMKSMELKINEYIYSLDAATKKAETDPLTGLYNRDAFERRVSAFLQHAEAEEKTQAFLMVDIDNFKMINDTYGHLVGDLVIKECARILKKIFRSADEVVRMGGDEFSIFCKSIGSLSIVENKAQELCAAMRTMQVEGLDCTTCVTISIGISLSPQDGTSYQELYQKADIALYQAKLNGRNRYVLAQETSSETKSGLLPVY